MLQRVFIEAERLQASRGQIQPIMFRRGYGLLRGPKHESERRERPGKRPPIWSPRNQPASHGPTVVHTKERRVMDGGVWAGMEASAFILPVIPPWTHMLLPPTFTE